MVTRQFRLSCQHIFISVLIQIKGAYRAQRAEENRTQTARALIISSVIVFDTALTEPMHTMDLLRDGARESTPATPTAPQAPSTSGLPAPIASWLQRVEAAAHPQPKLDLELKDPKIAQYKFVYVLAPTSGGRHVALCLCKARLKPNGEVAAASPVSEVFSLLSAPPAYLEGDDEDLVRFFIAMRSGAASQGSRMAPWRPVLVLAGSSTSYPAGGAPAPVSQPRKATRAAANSSGVRPAA